MTEIDAWEFIRATIWVVIIASGPAVAGAMLVGTVISFLQAVTQIQEVTLTFVPKIVAVLLISLLAGRFVGEQLFVFTELVYGRIETPHN